MKKEKKVDENLEITIKETPDEKVGVIKELVFSLNTGQSGKAQFISPVINGELEAVIMSSDKQVEVLISFEPFRDVVLYENVSFSGRKYLPLRVEPVFSDATKLKNGFVKWALNNSLWFSVSGAMNSTVNFIVRWE